MNSTKFFIDQHGCAKNQVDGELIISLLKKKNWIQTFDASQADLIIVNSCGFIESAKTESLDAVMSARRMYPKAKILLAGCLAERYANDLRDSLTEADGFFGNGKLDEIYKILDPLMNDERPVLVPEQKGVCCGDRKLLLNFPGSAFVKITEGCNNRCSFCAIPLIRGNLRSRPADEIITEISYIKSHRISLFGIIINEYDIESDNIEQKYLPHLIKEYTAGTKILGCVPHIDEIRPDTLIAQTLNSFNIEEIFGLEIAKLH